MNIGKSNTCVSLIAVSPIFQLDIPVMNPGIQYCKLFTFDTGSVVGYRNNQILLRYDYFYRDFTLDRKSVV